MISKYQKRRNRKRENWAMLKQSSSRHQENDKTSFCCTQQDDDYTDDVRDIRNHISPLVKVIEIDTTK